MVLIVRMSEKGPEVIRLVCLERGWELYDKTCHSADHWNMWWKTTRFTKSQLESCNPYQRVNHFPKTGEITRKDTLLRNLRRMKGIYGKIFDFFPEGFILPSDYRGFVRTYAQEEMEGKKGVWICKPSDLSRGRKIFLFKDLRDLAYDSKYVVQRYVERPLLIGGYKFDLRIYVLVTSFHPLRSFIYRDGLARFGSEKYNIGDLEDKFGHLTNASINKHNPTVGEEREAIGSGCKWDFTHFTDFMIRSGIDHQSLWRRIENILILTLLSIVWEVPEFPQCFELLGFDVILDEMLKPWLLEVNFSPSLNIGTEVDVRVKKPLISDMLDVLGIEDYDKVGYDDIVEHISRHPRTAMHPLHDRSTTADQKAKLQKTIDLLTGSAGKEKEADPDQLGRFEHLVPSATIGSELVDPLSVKKDPTTMRKIVSICKKIEGEAISRQKGSTYMANMTGSSLQRKKTTTSSSSSLSLSSLSSDAGKEDDLKDQDDIEPT